jgi:hypothetical protein
LNLDAFLYSVICFSNKNINKYFSNNLSNTNDISFSLNNLLNFNPIKIPLKSRISLYINGTILNITFKFSIIKLNIQLIYDYFYIPRKKW